VASKTELLERWSYIATIVASVVAIVTLCFGYWQFADTQHMQRETLQLERESKAIDLTLKFNELKGDGARKSDRAWVQDNEATTIAESIFDLVGDDPGWRATVKWMLEDEAQYTKDNHLGCDSFNPGFVAYAKTVLGSNICE
jgi:hypothetical protein